MTMRTAARYVERAAGRDYNEGFFDQKEVDVLNIAIPRVPNRSGWKLVVMSFVIAIFFIPKCPACGESEPDKPNILFIFADDQCHETIRALGHTEVQTPNLDRLARSGVTFSNAYNMGSWTGAVCVASRTMLNTGRSVWRAQRADFKQILHQQQAWSQMLRKAGYETYMSGKWHVAGLPPKRIFDHVAHVRPGMPNQTPEGYQRPEEGKKDPWSPSDPKFGGFWKGGKHWSEVLGDDATQFLQQAAKSDKPFFMYLAFNAPHDPRQSPQRFVDMYPTESIQVPNNFLAEYPFMSQIGLLNISKTANGETKHVFLRDENLAPWPRTEYAVKVHRQEYFAIISHMDEQIGRILDALHATGKAQDTYIFFTADHGLACGHHGLLGKQNMYEHSMRPPLIVHGPGIPRGESREACIYLQDIMPTTLDLAGVEKPDFVEFHSLLPHIRDPQSPSDYDSIYGCYLAGMQRMIRVGDWKLIVYPQAHVVRLYNLAQDAQEMHDLAAVPQQQQRIRNMFGQLVQLQRDMGDTLDLHAAFPEL
jgi:arylsulfatase A-like enzyme